MINGVDVLIDLDILEAVQEVARNARAALRKRIYAIVNSSPAVAAIRDLSTEPGSVVYANNGKLRWKNDRQRRKVLRELRIKGNLPYSRDHSLANGWTMLINDLEEGEGVLILYNRSKIWPFVQGDSTQPFHLDTGWPQVAIIRGEYQEELQNEVVKAWYETVRIK